ncbi:copper resistance protein CopC [Pseudoglutamicibacter cumminsii]|uniref:Copper resistance protein CopC n=1 Tax=Pseudoglutamicibacter cumminsii TaxID=156979 RepID=A0AAP4C653_9MICC|nr:copper resistance CopC family protein [Pseudoglutamicibacter cumminsii]MDK6274741.1 copper resistance protein CopC [Pseudoglutamicibacter cumminsii]MDK7083450.1 copper resistance protein CopC [Pseudoglutamicibacter cumminsii]
MTRTLPRPIAALSAAAFALLLVIASVFGASVFGASPAQAHDRLVKSTPSSEAALDQSPGNITLEFSGRPMDLGTMIMVVDAEQKNYAEGLDPELKDFKVTQPLTEDLPDGNYEVRWRVVSEDGHPISGTIPFSVGDVTNAPKVPALEGKDVDSGSIYDGAAEAADGADSTKESGVPVWVIAAAGAGVVIVGLAIWYFASRGTKTN